MNYSKLIRMEEDSFEWTETHSNEKELIRMTETHSNEKGLIRMIAAI